MNAFRVWCSLVVVAALATARAPAQEKGDLALREGQWQVTKMVKRGTVLEPERIEGLAWVFASGKATILDRGSKRSFAVKIDAAKKLKEMDLTAEDGPFKGQSVPAIYRLEGDILLICTPHDKNTERPNAFEALGGAFPSRILWTLKRIKKS